MTHRQWVMLQVALLHLNDVVKDGVVFWDEANDGPPPTPIEVDELAELVGGLPHKTRTK